MDATTPTTNEKPEPNKNPTDIKMPGEVAIGGLTPVRYASATTNPGGTPKLNEALSKAQSEFRPIEKNKHVKVKMKSGGEYEFDYADLAEILDKTREGLTRYGLSITNRVVPHGTNYTLVVELRHASGEIITSSLPIDLRNGPQELGSILTYYRRYLVSGLLGVASDEDDDGNIAQGNKATQSSKSRNGDVNNTNRAANGGANSTRPPASNAKPGSDTKPAAPKNQASKAKLDMAEQFKKSGWTKEQAGEFMKATFGKDSSDQLTDGEATDVANAMGYSFNEAMVIFEKPAAQV